MIPLPGPSLGPFAGTIQPLITTTLGIVTYAAMVYILYKIILSVSEWLKAKSSRSYAAQNAAEETLFPPLFALCGLMILPAIVAAVVSAVS